MTEEDIIRRKLMFDGGGLGEERRINMLQKLIIKWTMTETSEFETINTYNKILSVISTMEHSRHKSDLVKTNYEQELKIYKNYQLQINNNITSIKEAINTSKLLLAEVRIQKHQKLNYNMIAENIAAEPSRTETGKHITKLNQQIDELQKQIKRLNSEWLRLRQQFNLIANSAGNLWYFLEEDL